MSTKVMEDSLAIRSIVDKWILLRDAGDWSNLAKCWHPGGTMSSTRFCGSADTFIEHTRLAFERGANVQHFQCGFQCNVAGHHAITQVRMQIKQRAWIDDVEVDATCTGRFYDFFEKRIGRWAIVRRQPIYEVDRLDVVEPGARLVLDPVLLGQFPPAYRHLAYLQTKSGFTVQRNLPELRGALVEALYAEGRAWLAEVAPVMAIINQEGK